MRIERNGLFSDSKIVARNMILTTAAAIASMILCAGALAQQKQPEKKNMDLVGYNDLQGRSAYQPVIQKQGDRWIAYVGHHAGVVLIRLPAKTNRTVLRLSMLPIPSIPNISRTFPAN